MMKENVFTGCTIVATGKLAHLQEMKSTRRF